MPVETPIPGAKNGTAHTEINAKTSASGVLKTGSHVNHSTIHEKQPTAFDNGQANVDRSSVALEAFKDDSSCAVLDPSAGRQQSRDGFPAGLNLPTDHARAGDHSFAGSTASTFLQDPVKSQLLKLASGHDLNLSTVVLAAWTIALSRFSGQEFINLGVGSNGQTGTLLAPVTRNFDLSGSPSTSELLERIKLIDENGCVRQSAFKESMHFALDDGASFPQACFYSYTGDHLDHTVSMQSYLELHLVQDGAIFSTSIRFATDLYNQATIEKYAGVLETVLMNMATNRTQPVAELGVVQTQPPKPVLVERATDFSVDDDDEDDMMAYVGADPRALSAPVVDPFVPEDYVSPQGEIEMALAEMSAELLNVPQISRDDDFFELGGHSIMAMRLMNSVAAKFGQQVPMSSFFAAPTLHGLAEAVSCSISQGISAHTSIPQVSRSGPQELSFAQQRLWFLESSGGANDNYHIPCALHLRGALNHVSLRGALNTIYARHEALRSAFPTVDGKAKVEILPTNDGMPFETLDVRHDQDPEVAAIQVSIQEGCAPFDMERGPLVRVKLIQLAEEEHIFLLTVHHIVSDGWSMGVMFRELNALYEAYSTGKANPLAPLPIQYLDYAAWQRTQLTQKVLKDQADFWRKRLADSPACIELPTDRPRPPQQSFAGASVPVRFNSQLTRDLQTLSQKYGATMFMTVLAGWSAVLARLSGQDDVVIGTPSANRNHPQVEQLIGFFVSTLALRIDLSEEPSVKHLLERVRESTISAQTHQDLPFEQVVEAVRPPRRADITPIFQVMLAWQSNDHDGLDLMNVQISTENIQYNTLKFDLNLELFERNGEITGSLNYSAALFDSTTIERHVGYLGEMLLWMATDTEDSIFMAPILAAPEQELLIETWNATEQPYPKESCIHELFEKQVELSPNAVAIVHDERSVTYRELNSHANWIAEQLIEAGVAPKEYVLLLLERSINLVASQIAVLKIGGAFVPMDINAPMERQTYIAADCGSTVLIADSFTAIPDAYQGTVIRLGEEVQLSIDYTKGKYDGFNTSSRDVAYVMYTSGSTGQPKGVLVAHQGVVRLAVNSGFMEVDSCDRVAFVASPAFDVSMFDIWTPLLNGAGVVVIDRDTLLDAHRLAGALDEYKITILSLTTALFHQHSHVIGPALSRLRYVLAAGEQALSEPFSSLAGISPHICVVNAYGPTEATVFATTYKVTNAAGQLGRLPIGRPISNTRAYVLDKHLAPVPIGVAGELHIGGPGVAIGYLNQPDLSAERFIADPFVDVQGARMYKTGDLVRYLPDGNLVFLGRNDNQVKIRGYRIELGEIESRLVEHHLVNEAVIVAVGDATDDKRLVAYVVAEPVDQLMNTLHEHLSSSLPEYMVPAVFVRMDAFPLNSNGKINRHALPEPASDSFVTCEYEAPQGELEVALAEIWSDLLKNQRVGRHDNFFMLGGHSLLAVRLMNRMSTVGIHIPLSVLFSCKTLAALATTISSINSHATSHSVISRQRDQELLQLSSGQQRLWFLVQMDGLSEAYHVPIATRLTGPLAHEVLKKTIYTLYGRHEALRSTFVAVNSQPLVRTLPTDSMLPFNIHDLRVDHDREAVAKRLVAHDVKAPFNLAQGPLVRATLIQLQDEEHIFLITMHHIVTDGWSTGVMFREMSSLYKAYSLEEPDPLVPLSIQYPDYAAWQRQQLTLENLKDQVSYWRQNMAAAPASIELPTDRPRPNQQSFAGAMVPIRIDRVLTRSLKNLAHTHGVTLFMTVLAAWSAVLSRLSGQDEIVVGTPSANRNHPQAEQLIGFFVNTLALRINLAEDPSTKQLLEHVRRVTLGAQAHQDLPFDRVVEAVNPPRRTDMTPIFQVMLAWQNNDIDSLKLHNIKSVLEQTPYNVAKFDLDLSLGESDGEIVGGLSYSTAIFDGETIERHICYLEAVLLLMSADRGEYISSIPIVGSSERHLLLEVWNATKAPYPDEMCIHQLFEHQVKKAPHAVAIIHNEHSLTYHELNSRANWISKQLVENGIKSGDYVMLLLDRSIELVASQIAVLKVGAAYIPIDTNAPLERQSYIASDCGSKITITDGSKEVPATFKGAVLRLNEGHNNPNDTPDYLSQYTTSSLSTAYVMYTSGSTGLPKGVIVSHRSIVNLVLNSDFNELGPEDTLAFTTNPAFDPSTFEVWATLVRGARIAILDKHTFLDPHRLAEELAVHHITLLQMSNGLLNRYAYLIGDSLSRLKYLVGGGEQASLKAFAAILAHSGRVRVVNQYGPTETTMTATAFTATSLHDQHERLPIGRPIPNVRAYVLDRHLGPVPRGVVGELYIGGPGVAIGYLNQPDLSAERFIADPFVDVQGARMYKTGDLVRYLPDGNLVFLGRNDNQVKIRGYRIELGEIESRLVEHHLVNEAVIVAVGDATDDKRLVAYVVAEPVDQLMNTLHEHLSSSLPEYMVPAVFVRMDAFPLNSNGKIDHRALPQPSESSFQSRDYEQPQGNLEAVLAGIWTSLLKIERVSRRDNFFKLGGHSLMAVRMIEQLRQQGFALSVRALFENPVLYALASSLHQQQAEAAVPPNLITTATTALTPDLLPLIDLTQQDINIIVDQIPGGVSNIQDIYSLSPLQDGILFHHMMESVGDTYLLVVCRVFHDKEFLERYLGAMQKVVDRHDNLRTAFVWKNMSTPAQVVLRQASLLVVEHSLDPADGPIPDQLMQMYDTRQYRIELNEAPLTRFAYAQDRNGRWVMVQLLHHLTGDHSTLEVMQEEIEKIMDGCSEALPNPHPYRNLIAQVRMGANAEDQERFFKEMLHDIEAPSLPFGLSDVYGDGANVKDYHCMLPQDLNDKLRGHARRLGVSLASLCHLAWAQVVAATSGQSKVVFGTVLFGRMQGGAGSDRTMGLHINTLPLRVDIDESGVLDSVLKVHADLAGLLEHEHASMAVANQCSAIQSGTPLFSSMLNYRHNSPAARDKHAKNIMEVVSAEERTNYPIDMSIEDYGSRLGLTAQIVDPYEPSRICGYMEQALLSLAESLEHSPDVSVHSLCVLPAGEYKMVVETWNSTDAPYPDDECIHQLFEKQVEATPNAVAIVHNDQSLTYRELDDRANWISQQLVDIGVKPSDYVMLLFDRSVDLVASQIAVLKVGAAYIPIDTRAPAERQAYMASDCGSIVIVADENREIPVGIEGTVLRIGASDHGAGNVQIDKFATAVSSHDTAYVMYTSGSTGRPKGVLVHHRGIARLVFNNGYTEITPDDCVGFVSNPSSDPSTFEVWSAILHGARLLIVDTDTVLDAHRLEATILRHRVTALFMASAIFHRHVFVIGRTLSNLKYLLGGGEQALAEAYATMAQFGGRCSLINAYGPTESTVDATTFTITSTMNNWESIATIPIGKPISNTKAYVLNKQGLPVPLGVAGELYIGGPGVATGYLNRPDLTAERFIPDPFSKIQGARMYKTGDLVRYLSDGNLVFLSRNDNQIKLRGFRVELGEIETRLTEHPQVRETVVLAVGEAGEDKRLVAYVVADAHDGLVPMLREHLSVVLPEYMLPSAIVRMDKFPLNNNGKIDRRALPEPTSDSYLVTEYSAPQGELEVSLATIWSDLLKIERVGRHDNFFLLGGHSLLAVRLINRLSSLGLCIPLSALFSNPTLATFAMVVSTSVNSIDAAHLPIAVTTRDRPLVLSFAQQRLWFLTQMEGLSEIYHVPFAIRLRGPLHYDSVQKTLNALFSRHESLRSVFIAVDGQPQLKILPADIGLSLVVHDLRSKHERESMVESLSAQEIKSPFNLVQGPLIRASLIRLADDEHVLLITMHHIVTDGWSMGVVFRELNALYNAYSTGRPHALAPLTIQYPDYAVWQRQQLSVEKLQAQADYWSKSLADAPVCLDLPMDRPRPVHQSFAGASVPIHISSNLTRDLKLLSQKHGVTMFMTFLAAWSAVLSRLSGQEDIVIGTPSANRSHPQVEQMIGFFVSTLALRIDLSEEPSSKQLLERVCKATLGAQAHQDIQFDQVVEIVRPPRRTDISPIFQVMFSWHNNDLDTLNLSSIESVYEPQRYDVAKFDLELFLTEKDGEVVGALNYSTALFDRQTIERHTGYLEEMMRWMSSETDKCFGQAPIIALSERKLLLETWNATDQPYSETCCIHQLFEKQVEATPNAVAIVHNDQSLTYRELNDRANWIAHQLREIGVDPGEYVMLLLERSIDLVASQIAILKIGAAFVPIDTKAPLERQIFIATDCESKFIVTADDTVVHDGIQGAVLRLDIRDGLTRDTAADIGNLVSSNTSSRDTAYVMYTSGSTGVPKGVVVHHRGIVSLIYNSGFEELTPSGRMAFTSNPTFDASIYQVWAPLLVGASIIVIHNNTFLHPTLLTEAIQRYQITCLYMTNGLLHQHAFTMGHILSKLKYLFAGAEQGRIEAYREVLQHGGPVRLINQYGPTETTMYVTTYTATSDLNKLERLPIGRPVSNTRVYVLDKDLAPVPLGVMGELYIGGSGVATGYLNRPDLTAERFIPDPFSKIHGARMYKTGDLVRYLSDGNLVFLARNDNQVKIRGYRIELGEIESRLVDHPLVREAVVVAVDDAGKDKRLVAYVVAEPVADLAPSLRDFLSVGLPEYMVPGAFVRVDAFPLTNNGKIDKHALPQEYELSCSPRDYEEPQGHVEIAIAAIWATLLNLDRVSRRGNFFMLGGHSLMAVRMIEQLRHQGFVLPVRALFENPVLCDLATCLHQDQACVAVPPNVITPATKDLTPEMLPLIDLTQDDIDIIDRQVPGGVANIQDIYALSPLQDGILFHHMMATAGDTYLLVTCRAFRDRKLLDRYLDAYQKVVDRHDSFRTALIWKGLSTPAQVVLRKAPISVVEHSLDPADGPIPDQLMQMYDTRQYRIELNEAPLTRFAYAQDQEGKLVVIHLLHHLTGDHSAGEVTQEEIEMIMDGCSEALPNPHPYRNLIAQVRMGANAEDQERFFKEMLHDIEAPSLPFGLSDVYGDGANVKDYHCMLPQDLNDKLRGHARRLGVSLASLCHLAWAQVVAATSGQSKVVFGTVLFGRMQGGAGSERTIGLYINTLPFRVDIEGASVIKSVRKVHVDLARLLEHEHASLAIANQCSSVPSRTPLFSSILNYRHNSAPARGYASIVGVEEISGQERSNYPIGMSIEDQGFSLGLTSQVACPYEPSSICRYMEQALHSLADALEQSSNIPIQALNVLPAEEYDQIVNGWNNTYAQYPHGTCIQQLFERQVNQVPDSVAIVHDEQTLTYRELNSRANWIAQKLVAIGVAPGDPVMLLFDRSIGLVASQIAVLKIGGAYVPIDTNAPLERQSYIASDCGAAVVITDESTEVPSAIQGSVIRLSANHIDADYVQDNPKYSGGCSLDTANIMYTSGSTGRPKGVMVPHRGIARLVLNNGYTEITPNDCVGLMINPSFDPSTFEIWTALLHGARLVVIDKETVLDADLLEALILRHQMTVLFMASAILHRHVFTIGRTLSKLRYLLAGGEQALVEAYAEMARQGGHCRVINTYGPTEASVHATTFTVTSEMTDWENVPILPIGKPLSNTSVYVLDKYYQPVPLGVVGELYIGGPGVANGYLNRPDLTAERFLPDPFAKVQGARMYRTGDLVRYLTDGNLVFLGRNDDQIKIRGYRVELGEIESRIAEHSLVREVLVLAVGETSEAKRLVAYVVAEQEESLARALQEHLSVKLPEYMIPTVFVPMATFPLTNNGKVDRRSLPKPETDSLRSSDYVAPESKLEVAMAAIWSDLLQVEKVGRHDNFFMLGGHSLLAVRFISILRTNMGVNLRLHMLFSNPTLSGLALQLDRVSANDGQDNDEYSVMLPLKPQGNRPPLFCIHPAPGLAWSYRGLAKSLHPEQPLYGLQCRGVDGKSPLPGSIDEMCLDYIDQIRKIQPRGPYHLLGWSLGGKIAHSMATKLQSQGESVPFLTIMDTPSMSTVENEVSLSATEEATTECTEESLSSTVPIDSSEYTEYISRKFDEFLGRLAGHSSTEGDDFLSMGKIVGPILAHNIGLADQFKPLVYRGNLLYFKASALSKQDLIDPACWEPYVSGNIKVHEIPSAHAEMDKPEYIEMIGRIVAAQMVKLH